MRVSLFPVALLVSAAAAMTTTYSASSAAYTETCGALPVLNQCISSTQIIAKACKPTDYSCLCDKWNVVVVCFDVCPNDDRLSGIQNTAASYCAYAPTTTSAIVTPTKTPTPSSTSSGGPSPVAGGSTPATNGTSTGGSSGSSATGGANNVVLGAGSVMMCLAGLVGAFL
ncbi:hypothetical protein LZ554_007497 [Drepanopeziza brunnea f. sp. 'monogermtubi']|nr:hypothetical protein LZ554_007497 [Drepanopeziza brunnea f. sp. 'monogermtubi']